MKTLRYFVAVASVALLFLGLGRTASAQWSIGGATDFFVPISFSEISEVGLAFELYAGRSLSRRKWAFEVDTGLHWFTPRTLTEEEIPDWVQNPELDEDGTISMSGSFIPLRASITRLFGRYYVSPRVGIYLPVGDMNNKVGMDASFGVAPRIGYFFPIYRTVHFDFAFEYNHIFWSEQQFNYIGVSMGLLFGGRRLGRYY